MPSSRAAGRRRRVLDAVLLLLDLDLGRSSDLDDRDAAGQLREALLERSKSRSVFSISCFSCLMRPLIASVSPAPSMIVVVSLSMTILRALPSCEGFVFSSLRPISSVMTSPPVMIAMSSSIRLRQSPKRCLHRDGGERAAELVDDDRRERLALDVLGHDEQRPRPG